MKKNILNVLFMVLVLLFVACDNLANPNNDDSSNSNKDEKISAGWYKYTTNADSDYPQITIFFINETGAIERAGNTTDEYTGDVLEMMQNQLSYSICKKNADSKVITFTKTEAPTWADTSSTPSKICPYEEGEYLDAYQLYKTHNETYITIEWPINKNIPLWSYYEGNIYYDCSCSEVYGYIRDDVFIIGKNLKVGDSLSIYASFIEEDITIRVTFTEPTTQIPSGGSNTETTLPTGYEWWCFEEAFIGYKYFYVLYYNDEAIRCGVETKEIDVNDYYFLYGDKNYATNNYLGTFYKVTDLTKLPAWAL